MSGASGGRGAFERSLLYAELILDLYPLRGSEAVPARSRPGVPTNFVKLSGTESRTIAGRGR
jgi:hypothetical protein